MNPTSQTNSQHFDYDTAFSRNIGWVTSEEQKTLSRVKIALPGLGGVGGHHFHNFLRLGVQHFHIADFDTFSLSNFNRQLGARCDTIGQSKVEAMTELAKSINPNSTIKTFPEGVTPENSQAFLEGVDLIVDTLDLFAMDIRIHLYDLAHQLGIPMITAGPFGMGTSVMAFSPSGPIFSDFFDLKGEGLTVNQQILRFISTLTPVDILLKSYLVADEGINSNEKRLPSLNVGCDAAAAALGSLALKILLKRPNILWAPKGFYVDFYLHRSKIIHAPFGAKGWRQRLKLRALEKRFA
ncbi:MAG: ThiF family adenylyltransferase [Pseudobdellovibrionaceae bacterium]|nr:ThiF family adenylyltransferase [Bdellovibrionales bacterium]USN46930.1 MAG: ThiF family adenylyltransferase [Pseudobdellovibrionaceae bacterium]